MNLHKRISRLRPQSHVSPRISFDADCKIVISDTPEEAGMKLLPAPRLFSLHTSRHLIRLLGRSDDPVAQVPVLRGLKAAVLPTLLFKIDRIPVTGSCPPS